MFQANVINIMIAGPSDVSSEVESVKTVIYEWNELNASTYNMVLRPIHWKTSSFPSLLCDDGQTAINKQLVETSDVLICLFGQRLGSPTPRAKSGTVEEIELHRKSGKEVMVFFKETIDADCDEAQFTALREFKAYLREKGLLGAYKDAVNLKDEVRRVLNLFVNNFVRTLQSPQDQNPPKQEDVTPFPQEQETSRMVQNPSKNEEDTQIFSDEELKRLHLWCASNSNLYNKVNFEDGGCIYMLGNKHYEVTSGRDIAQWSKFIKTLLEQGLIEHTGQYTKQREPLYQLTSKAYDIF